MQHDPQDIPAHGGGPIVSNHQSPLGPILLPLRFHWPLNDIAKSELFENDFFGWFLRAIFNALSVRQGHVDVRAEKDTILRFQEGHLMSIYPKGARTEDGEIAPLQRGVAWARLTIRAVVVPAVNVGAFEAWPIHRWYFRRRPVRIQLGPPMNFAGGVRDEIQAIIDQTLSSMFAKLRAQVGSDAAEPKFKSG